MGIYSLLYRIFGSVTLKLDGGFFAAFLNMCRSGSVICRGVHFSSGSLYADVAPQDMYKIRHIARQTAMKVRIVKRTGLSFTLHRCRRRFGFAVGIVLFAAINLFLSNFIWSVDIVGQSGNYTNEQIMAALSDVGIFEGAPISGIDADSAENELLIRLNLLKRLAVSVVGTSVTVEITDKSGSPKDEPETPAPADVIAKCDAYIVGISATDGEAAVRPGDTVQKGQKLISGVYSDKTGRAFAVRADGTVIGQTVRDVEFEISRKNTKPEPTGRKYQKNSVFFFGIRINLYIDSRNRYKECDIISDRNRLKLFGKELPIYVDTVTVSELAADGRYLTDAELEKSARQAIERYENDVLDGCVIVSRSVGVSADSETCVLRVRYVCEEDIGEIKELDFQNGE